MRHSKVEQNILKIFYKIYKLFILIFFKPLKGLEKEYAENSQYNPFLRKPYLKF
tara:strand:- start:476 stop:637 length:162 start_codon:yes stop_codon:yes gene_type:complete